MITLNHTDHNPFTLLVLSCFTLLLLSNLITVPGVGSHVFSLTKNIFEFVCFVGLISLGCVTCTLNKQFVFKRVVVLAVGFVLLLLLPSFWNTTSGLLDTFPRIGMLILGVLSLCVLPSLCTPHHHKFIFAGILLLGLYQSGLGLFQLFTQSNSKVYGSFYQVNVFGSFLAVVSMVWIYCYSKYLHYLNHKYIWLSLALFSVCLNAYLTVIATDSIRLVALICAFSSIFLIKDASYVKSWRHPSILLILLPIIILLTPRPILLGEDSANRQPHTFHAFDSSQAFTQSLGARPYMYQVSIEAFMSQPFTGHGMGHFEKAFLSQQIINNPTQSNGIHQYQQRHPHNELLLWLVEQGLLAGVAFILLFFGMLFLMWRGHVDYKIALLTLPLVLHSLTEYPFYQSILHYALLLILLSLSSSKDRGFLLTIRPLHLSYLVPINALVFILPIMFSVGSYQANTALVRFYQSNATAAETLLSQTHTLGFMRLYNFEMLTWALNTRAEPSRQQRHALRFYAKKVAQDFASKPNPELGYRLIDAQLSLGQMKTALNTLDEFRRYFPHATKDPGELFAARGFNVNFDGLIKKGS